MVKCNRDCTYGEKQEEKMKNLLPLGSVVRLNKGELKIMIISRLPLYNNEGTIGYFDYAACVYPTGQADQQVHFLMKKILQKYFSRAIEMN